MTETVLAAALAWYDGGTCPIRAMVDGSKAPLGTWETYQTKRPTREQVERWFAAGHPALGLVCGATSGGLEMTELEGRAIAEGARERLIPALRAAGVYEIWERLVTGYAEFSPSGGLHLLYRLSDHEVPGNTKVARRPARDDELTDDERAVRTRLPGKVFPRVLAETRGEGGFVVVAPSNGTTHSSGQPWARAEGARYGHLPSLSWAERTALHAAIRAVLDEMPEQAPAAPKRAERFDAARGIDGERPGDQWARETSWAQILEPHGWTLVYRHGDMTYWRRPGKKPPGWSARTGGRYDSMFVWSTSTELPAEESLTKFRVYALLEHGGDDSAGARELRRQGYGAAPSEWSTVDRRAVAEWVPAPDQPPDDPGPSRFTSTLLRRSQLADLPPTAPLIEDVLSLRSAAVLFGPTGVGKTFLTLGWACAVGTGVSWLGHPVTRCPVLYVVGEGATGLDVRIAAWEFAWQTKVADEDVIFSVKPDSFAGRDVWAELTAEARTLGVRFVVLDTFSSLAPDADETKDAPTFTRRLSDLATAIDGTALVVHHPGWSDADRTRGGYQLEANVDEVLKLAGSGASDLIELTRKKVKEGPSGDRTWLRRRFHHLGDDVDGKPYGSAVIEAASAAERALRAVDEGEAVVREVFAVGTASKAQIRDALVERLDVSRTTAYQHVGRLLTSGVLRQVGGTDQRPIYEVSRP